MQYVGATTALLAAVWFLLAALSPATALRRTVVNMSRGQRLGVAATGIVLLLFAGIGFAFR